MNLPKYNIRALLVLTVAVSMAAALIADEPISIGLASVFCVVSYSGIAILIVVSAGNLWRQLRMALANRSLRPLISRIKWLIIDTVIVVWLFASISITNYVLANHVKHAPWLLLIGALISPFAAYRLAQTGLAQTDSRSQRSATENKLAADRHSVAAKVND